MRIRKSRLVASVLFVLNLVLLFLTSKLVRKLSINKYAYAIEKTAILGLTSPERVDRNLTIIIRKFEHFENDVVGTVESFLNLFSAVRVVIVSDSLPYPPLVWRPTNYSLERVSIVTLKPTLNSTPSNNDPLSNVLTSCVLFVPDSTRIHDVETLVSMVSELERHPSSIVSGALSDAGIVECLKVNLNLREWFIEYSTIANDVCDSINGKHVILVSTDTLRKLPRPFLLPFPEAFYIQAAAQNIKAKLVKPGGLTDGKPLFRNGHAYLKLQELQQRKLKTMYSEFGVKKVVRETGVIEWYGCNRETERCFPSIIGDMPRYLWEGKWTPPCCLAGLRRTARHVFAQLDQSGVRYWLEGGSLLGAMRSGDILPWDYDVDLGLYHEDLSRCRWLARAQTESVIDSDGFVWKKATEGDFFRVQYSLINHLHVDLFPFHEVNGTMTKNTWFPTHKQDREFPEDFLHPISSIDFVGRQVPAPNNIRDFLELKFGKRVIENPEYPDPSKMKFPHN